MDTIELLTKFADPEVMKTLSVMDRMMAGLITTILGMGITFVALIILQFVIVIMAKLSAEKEKPVALQPANIETPATEQLSQQNDLVKDEEIVAAITTAIALQLKTSVSKIVIRNIEKIGESSGAWQKAGIAEHMNTKL